MLNKSPGRTRWTSLVEGSVLLVSACKVAVPSVEGSGVTERVGSVAAVEMPSTTPAAKMRPGHYFDFIEQNDSILHHNCTTYDYSRRRTRSTQFIVRVGKLGPGWSRIYREGWGGGVRLVRN